MNILSVFGGIECGRVALERAGITADKYYSSEVDKYAMQIANNNYQDIIQLGDVEKWSEWDIEQPDLIMGGSPCQGFSLAGKQLNFSDHRSRLFFDFVAILRHYKPKYFLLENVKMKKEYRDAISAVMGCEPVLINSSLVSAQNRNRYYWTNIPGITQPEDKGILLKDIIERDAVDRDKSHCLDANYYKGGNLKSYFEKNRRQLVFINQKPRGNNPDGIRAEDGKTPSMTSSSWEHNNHLVTARPCKSREFKEESLCHHAADATDINGNESLKRVYAETGKAPTLTTMSGGHREPKVLCGAMRGRYLVDGVHQDGKMKTAGRTKQYIELRHDEKTNTLTTVQKDNHVVLTKSEKVRHETGELTYRKLTPLECERLQTLPDDYTLVMKGGKQVVSNSQRYKGIGNGWTVDVIAWMFKGLKE